MSSNDYLRILKVGDAVWCVSHRDADTDEEITHIGQVYDFDKASNLANDYQETEYGVHVEYL